MKKVLFVFQNILTFILIYLISFIWLRFLLKPLWLDFVIAFIATIFVEILLHIYFRKSKNNQSLKLKEKERADDIFLSLSLEQNPLEFFLQLAKSRHQLVNQYKDYISITFHEDTTLLYPYLKFKILDINELTLIINSCKNKAPKKIIILCYDYDKSVLSFAKNFDTNIIILDRYETYAKLYKEYDYFPQITKKYKKEAKLTFKELLAYSFNKSRTKGYLFASIVLLFTSFFVKINIYYLVISTILLLFALISYINPKYNSNKNKDLI